MNSRVDKNQKYFKCSCQLFIQNFKVSHAGYLYFIWVSGNKQTQTLKYDTISSTTTEMGQTLSLNLRVCQKNGKHIEKFTTLYLLNDQGQELDDIQINVSDWPPNFKEINIPVGGGSIHAKVRRKQIMQVQNMEQQSDQNYEQMAVRNSRGKTKITEHHERLMIQTGEKSFYIGKNQKSFMSGQMNSHSSDNNTNQQLLEELARVKKQLQDNVYLNNKLKNDRDVLMKKQQSLQYQIQTILISVSQDVKNLREHHQKKVTLRQTIYQQEIQEMIIMINGNSDYSRKVIQQILRQKAKIQEQNKSMIGQFEKAKKQLKQYKDKYQGDMQYLNQQMAKKIEQHQRQKQQEMRRVQEQVKKKKEQVQLIKIQVLKQKEDMQNQLQTYKIEFEKSRINNMSLQDELTEQMKKNEQRSVEMQQKVQQIQKASMNIRTLSEMLEAEQKLIAQLKGQVESLKSQTKGSNGQIINLNARLIQKDEALDQMKAQLQQITYELQFNQDAHKQLKVQHQEKQQELYNQLQNIQAIYNDKMEQFAKKLHQKMEQLNKQNNELRQKLGMSQKQLSDIQSQLLQKQSEIGFIRQSSQRVGGDKEQNVRRLENQKQQLRRQFQQKMRQMQKQMRNRDQDLASRIKELQEQLHITHKKKQQSEIKMKQYEKQIQQVNAARQGKQGKITEPPILLNRSIQMSRVNGLQSSQQPSRDEISLGPINNAKQLQRQLIKKEQQIHRLNNRIQQLNSWCTSLEQKLRQAHSMKLVQYCDSQKHQEDQINHDQRRKNHILDDLDTLQNQRSGKKGIDKSNPGLRSGDLIHDEANFGYTPKNQSYLKHRQSMGFTKQLSQNSNTSYIRVSHNKKIKEQQQLIKQFEQRQQQYKKQIQAYTQKIQELTKAIEKIKTQLEQYMLKPQINQSTLNELEQLRLMSSSQKQQIQSKAKLIAQIKQELSQLRPQLQHLRNLKPQLEQELKQVNKSFNELKQTAMQLEIKYKDSERRVQLSQQSNKKSSNELDNFSKIIAQFQQKIRQMKEHEQQLRMQNRELMFVNQQTSNQMKKYKSLYEQLEERLKKYAGSDVTVKELQKQVQEWNKRNLEQVRQFNHLKLEKDSMQEQMKLIKKRHGQQTRAAIQWEQKAAGLERTIDQYKRKQSKFKRQVEQAQEEVRKVRSQMKKLEEQLHTLQTLSTSFNYQKKKFLDELAQKGDELTRKQYENNRLLKELQKYRHKIQQSQDNRLGRKNQLRYQIQKLEAEVIKKDKRLLQMEEQSKILKGRLQFLQKQNTKIMQKKTQTYGDKLKHYIDEIASIKKLLDQYQTQNTKLKLQNNEFYQENQLLKLSFSKLQKKYEQNIDNQENILTDLQHYMDQLNVVSDKNRQYELELDRLQQSYIQIKKQLDDQKVQNRKKTERLESAQKTNGILMEQVKQFKIKLSQLQTQTKINYNINEKYRNLDRKKNQIEEEFKRIKQQYDSYRNIFVYKQDDVQKLCQQIRNSQRKQKEQQLNGAIDQITKTNNMKITKFEAELLEMFNENSRLREQILSKSEELGKTKLQISEFQSMMQKVLSLQNLIKQLNQQAAFNREQLKRRNDKMSKDQVYIKQLQTKIDSKQVQLVDSINRVNDLEMKIQKLSNKIAVLQQNQEALQDKILSLIKRQKESAQQNVSEQNSSQANPNSKQNIERKLFELELQLAKSKQRQNTLTVEYNTKIKSLQSKLQEMSETMTQHQKQLEKHYQQQLYKSQQSVLKLSEELQDKLIRIDQLNEAIIVLQQQNQQLAKQLSTTRYKLDQQTQIFNIQYGKLKQKLKESQDVYNQNLKSLQDQLTSMGKQLTIAKYNRTGQGQSGSRLKSSEIEDSKKTAKRMEEKMKTKDKKIQQLKSNIYILQETVLKLRKKQSTSQTLSNQFESLKAQYSNLEGELRNQVKRGQNELKSLQQLIRQLKQQLLFARQNEERSKITLQQKIMEFTSMQSELKTMKQLYSQLQKQIDRRKVNLSNQMEEESLVVIQLRNKESIINDLRQKIEELTMNSSSYATQNKKMSQEFKQISLQLKQQMIKSQTLFKQLQDSESAKGILKKQYQELRQKNLILEAQNKSLRAQLQKMKRFYEQSKSQLGKAYEQIQKFSKGNDMMGGRIKQYEQIVTKFKRLDEVSVKQIGASLEQLIDEGYFMQTLEQKQGEINQLIEQVEELKFLSDRKLLDYDELKRQNYELTLKAEDNEILTQQVENLRRICDKLEQQKKQAVFKQQLIKMHLGNLLQSNEQDDEYKRKIQHILRNVNSINQLGAVSFGESSFGNF